MERTASKRDAWSGRVDTAYLIGERNIRVLSYSMNEMAVSNNTVSKQEWPLLLGRLRRSFVNLAQFTSSR